MFLNRNKVRKNDKAANEDIINISNCKMMISSLLNLVDNLAERIHKFKCKDCNCFFEYKSVNDNLIKYKCLSCNKKLFKQDWRKIKKAIQE